MITLQTINSDVSAKRIIEDSLWLNETENAVQWEQPSSYTDYITIEPVAEAYSKDTLYLGFYLANNSTERYYCESDNITFLKQIDKKWYEISNVDGRDKVVLNEGDRFHQLFDLSTADGFPLNIGQYGISITYSDDEGNQYNNFVQFPVVEKGDIRTYEIWKPESPPAENIRLELESSAYAVYPEEIRGTLINEEGSRDRIYGADWTLLKKMDEYWRVIPRTLEKGWFMGVAYGLGEREEKVYELRDVFDYEFTPGEYAIALYISGNTPSEVVIFSEFNMY